MRPIYVGSLAAASIALALSSALPEPDEFKPVRSGSGKPPIFDMMTADRVTNDVYQHKLMRVIVSLESLCDQEERDITNAVLNVKESLSRQGHAVTCLEVLQAIEELAQQSDVRKKAIEWGAIYWRSLVDG